MTTRIDLPSAHAGVFRTLVDDGFALAIVLGSVAFSWTLALAIVAFSKLVS